MRYRRVPISARDSISKLGHELAPIAAFHPIVP